MEEQEQHAGIPEDRDPDAPIVVIGITGNIGSGKSTVAEMLRDEGEIVFSSDDTARRLMNEDSELKAQIRQNFGDAVYGSDGCIVSSALASLVFGPTPEHHARLALLDRLVHPRVLDEHQRQITECEEAGLATVFIESALIYEVGLEDAFDYMIVVDAPEEIRLQRAMQRSGATEEQIRNRMKEQMSAAEKIKNADFVLQNASTPEVLADAVHALLPILVLLPPRSADEDGDDSELDELSEHE